MKKFRNHAVIVAVALVSFMSIFAFSQEIIHVGEITEIGEGEIKVPKRPDAVRCGTHTCDDGNQYAYFQTKCPPGTNECTRQTCDEALQVILTNYCN